MIASWHRVALLAHHTLREAMRQRLHAAWLLLALVFLVGIQFLRDFNFGMPELKFIADVGFGVIGFFGAVFAVNVTVLLFFSELEHRTVLTVLARPVRRSEWVLGKFAGCALLVVLFCGVLTALLALVVWARETTLMREFPEAFPNGRVVSYAALAVTGMMSCLKLVVLESLTLVVASYALSATFAVIGGYVLWVVCHLQSVAIAATMSGTSPLRLVTRFVGWVFPDFQVFGLPAETGVAMWKHVAAVSLYGAGYIGAACALACLSFRSREI